MWYSDNKKPVSLDYTKPIIAEDKEDGAKFILLPQLGKQFNVVGYNWFSMDTGKYNSCICWSTIEGALDEYKRYTHYNAEIKLERI